ncbi:MAG TPA: T9SS type A sorting domain-containing protein, partial [Candidatus Kapabacteria bacterium]|nr:T9SS type A sorting domain-containing protein [Candidatus Kapabacteria bacterium]
GVYAGGGNGTQWFNDPGAPDSTRLPLVRTDSTVAAGFHTRFLLKSSKKIIEVTISDVNGIFLRSLRYDNYNQTANKIYSVKINDFSFVVPLDSDLSIKTISNYNDTLFSQTTNIIGTGFQFGLDTILSLGSSPTLASPANDSIFDGFNSWHPLKFMTKYRIQLADSQSMNFPIMDTILADTLVEYGIKSGEYFWRVAGINSEGQSKWSDVWKFKTPAPVLLSPPNDTVFAGTRYMTLQWDTLKSMDKYILQYSTDSTFHPANTLDSISSTMWLLSNLKLQTTYYWHVAGINSEGQSRWSDTWHFTTSVSSNVPQKNSEHAQLHCYPNPAANILNISLPASPENSAWLVLYDLQGRVIKKENILGRSGLQWDVADISKGVYFLDYVSGSVSQVMSVGIAR